MARLARVVVPGLPHHVTQRGNRRNIVFVDTDDREVYRSLLHKYSRLHDLKFWAYSLMTNHVHLIAVPATEISLANTLRDAHSMYALYFNQKHGVNGHLWQGRFYSCVLDEHHLVAAIRYVERNPVRAQMVVRAEDYPWSSAAAHCNQSEDVLLSDDCPISDIIRDWSSWLVDGDAKEDLDRIRRRTKTGRPCASEAFISELETRLGKNLSLRKPGRKRKSDHDECAYQDPQP